VAHLSEKPQEISKKVKEDAGKVLEKAAEEATGLLNQTNKDAERLIDKADKLLDKTASFCRACSFMSAGLIMMVSGLTILLVELL